MPSRDSQTVILSRQTILLVTAVGVGLLTLCYVLGVQVGKQSAALRRPAFRGAGEDLQELPASVADQLKALEEGKAADAVPAPTAPAPAAAAPQPAPVPADPAAPASTQPKPAAPKEVKMGPAPKPAADPAPEKAAPEKKPAEGQHWTLQLVSTPDQDEAQRMVAKVRAAGFPATVAHEKGLYKVRLTQVMAREAADATAARLKNRGFKPFAMKVEQP
jgi:cell division septation protein DedD